MFLRAKSKRNSYAELRHLPPVLREDPVPGPALEVLIFGLALVLGAFVMVAAANERRENPPGNSAPKQSLYAAMPQGAKPFVTASR